jgi:hypothetical protein
MVKFSFWDQPKPQGAIEGVLRDEILEELCTRRQSCLLATPYLSFESRMMELLEGELRVRATMSREAAKHTLSQQPLKLRFPWGLAFYAGLTRVLGYEQGEQRRTLRLAIPERLGPDELRAAYRLERVGRSQGALGTPSGTILRISLENISPLGAGVFCLEAIPPEGFQTGRAITLALNLDQGPSLNLEARVCHGQGQYLGLRFDPLPKGEEARRLQEWIDPRVVEAQRRWDNRAELRARAEQAAKPKVPPTGILLLGRDEALRQEVSRVMEGLHAVRHCIPVMAPFKEAMETPPLLLLVDTAGADMEERHRLRNLLEAQPPGCPVVVLGRGGDPELWRPLASELKARLYLTWNPDQGFFFQRVVQGLIQREAKRQRTILTD